MHEKLGMTRRQFNRFNRLIDDVADAEVAEHNNPLAPESNSSKLEAMAKKFNLKLEWPGIYPLIVLPTGEKVFLD